MRPSPLSVMGQQQLLLLVLGIVIVALAVVVGLQTFQDGRRKAAGDDLVTVSTRIAGEGVGWVLQPALLGGGANDPSGFTFARLGYTTDSSGVYHAADGQYTASATAARFAIEGRDPSFLMYAATVVYGPTADCVVTVTAQGSAPTLPSKPAGCSGW